MTPFQNTNSTDKPVPDEEVEREEGSADDEDDEVEVVVDGGLPLRLLVHLPGVHGVRHHLHPALEGRHLEERQVRVPHVVEVDLKKSIIS